MAAAGRLCFCSSDPDLRLQAGESGAADVFQATWLRLLEHIGRLDQAARVGILAGGHCTAREAAPYPSTALPADRSATSQPCDLGTSVHALEAAEYGGFTDSGPGTADEKPLHQAFRLRPGMRLGAPPGGQQHRAPVGEMPGHARDEASRGQHRRQCRCRVVRVVSWDAVRLGP